MWWWWISAFLRFVFAHWFGILLSEEICFYCHCFYCFFCPLYSSFYSSLTLLLSPSVSRNSNLDVDNLLAFWGSCFAVIVRDIENSVLKSVSFGLFLPSWCGGFFSSHISDLIVFYKDRASGSRSAKFSRNFLFQEWLLGRPLL